MRPTQLVRPIPVWACSLAVALATAACDSLYGLDGYSTHSSSIDGGGAVVVDGMVYVGSGSGIYGGMPGNVLLAYSVDGL